MDIFKKLYILFKTFIFAFGFTMRGYFVWACLLVYFGIGHLLIQCTIADAKQSSKKKKEKIKSNTQDLVPEKKKSRKPDRLSKTEIPALINKLKLFKEKIKVLLSETKRPFIIRRLKLLKKKINQKIIRLSKIENPFLIRKLVLEKKKKIEKLIRFPRVKK